MHTLPYSNEGNLPAVSLRLEPPPPPMAVCPNADEFPPFRPAILLPTTAEPPAPTTIGYEPLVAVTLPTGEQPPPDDSPTTDDI